LFCCGLYFLVRLKILNRVMCWNAFPWCWPWPEQRSLGAVTLSRKPEKTLLFSKS